MHDQSLSYGCHYQHHNQYNDNNNNFAFWVLGFFGMLASLE